MARLYIFAIGGTGSRVLKSLTMLLASGIKPNSNKEFEIVPIIIDPHKSNDDLKRTERLLGNYQAISEAAGHTNGFFNTKITTLDKLVSSENRLAKSFTFNLQEVGGKKFKEYIDFNQLDPSNSALADILFSGKSINKSGEEVNLLDVEMDIGFVGNPNIGSVVLNQFKDSEEFKEFASNYNEEDRVFIISSIFGGTGAAGFPTILKNIRDAMNNTNINGNMFLQDAKIGAISVMPYFNIESDPESPINKSDFISKTKSALYYYKDNVTGNNSINALYYILDEHNGNPYENDPGDNGQQNNAHIIEMISALSIIDFLEIPDNELETLNGKASRPIYKEFGIRKDSHDVILPDFEDKTQNKIGLNLSQLALFRKYLSENLTKSVEKQPWSIGEPQLNKMFFEQSFYNTNLKDFMNGFGEWLTELSINNRGFSPFNLDSTLDALVKGKTVKSGWLSKNVDYTLYDDTLNSKSKGRSYSSSEQKLLSLFFESSEEILKSKFGF